MTNEEKVKRLERLVAEKTSAAKDLKFVFAAEGSVAEFTADAAVLREAAQVMRERGTLLTGPDWKGMYEVLERDLAAFRDEREALVADRDTAISYADSLREQLRDAAKAEAARAVEALGRIEQQLEWIIDNGDTYQASALIEFVSRIRDNYFPIAAQPALDWLAQREREAAARELLLLADGCATVNPVLSWQLRACADGLTDQQPTACSRSEVRGKERL